MPGKPGETRHPGAGRIILEWGPWPRGSLKPVKYISGAMMDCSPEQALSKIYIMGISHSSFSYSEHGYCNASLGTGHSSYHSLIMYFIFGRATLSLLFFSNKLAYSMTAPEKLRRKTTLNKGIQPEMGVFISEKRK